MTLRYQDVFVPGGFPRHTYNPREELRLEERLSEARDNLCKLLTVTGQTKSGKTVLVKQVFPPEEAVWVDGGAVSREEDFWDVVISSLDLFQGISEQSTKESSGKISGKGTAEANFLLAKGSGEIGAELEKKRGESFVASRSTSSRVTALKRLREKRVSLVVDDFHYIPRCRRNHRATDIREARARPQAEDR